MDEQKDEQKVEKLNSVASVRVELEKFKVEQKETTDKILSILEGMTKPIKDDAAPLNNAPANSTTLLPQQYQLIFEQYFDVNDGFYAEMDFKDNITFTIIVPDKFSNMLSAQRLYYKVDKRTVVLHTGDIEGGIKKWCEKVCANLKYNKNIKTK